MFRLSISILLSSTFALVGSHVTAADDLFETKVQSIFVDKCGKCHSSKVAKSELRLHEYSGIREGGESGAVVVAGNLDESLLWQVIMDAQMPPEDEPALSIEEKRSIEQWILSGARSTAGSLDHVGNRSPSYRDVVPVMLRRCVMCHGAEYQRGEVDLRSYAEVIKMVQPGDSSKSLLLQRVTSEACPPADALGEAGIEPMTTQERLTVSAWIDAGASPTQLIPDVATTDGDPLVSSEDRDFWSIRPIESPEVPFSPDGSTPIDAFVQRRLKQIGLKIAEPASRDVLARRAAYALTGLPASSSARERFLNDTAPGAMGRFVDELMNSPHYGEKWARFWLDLAGYSDSEGKRNADTVRPFAWRYRDWVIRSLNEDLPYDAFLIQQLAGDELVDWGNQSELSEADIEKLVATGFLRMVPDGTSADPVNRFSDRIEVISDAIDVVGRGILGLTMNCARCHSHKYDPIPQRDYYRLVAVFKGAYDEYDWMTPQPFNNQWKDATNRFMTVMTSTERKQYQQRKAALTKEIDALSAKIEKASKEQAKSLNNQLKTLKTQLDATPRIRALWDRGRPSPTFVYRRGDEMQPAALVGPGVPSVLTDGKTPFVPITLDHSTPKTGRRLAFGKWLTDTKNPLTARVIVNRVWHQHFGRGIVESLDNFGRLGMEPSHPEMLDYLANDLIQHGWSLKRLNRQILLSATWQQPSTFPTDADRIGRDPENRLLSRMPMRRLSAEEVRDSLLVAAGRLNRQPYGQPDPVDVRKDGLVTSKAINGQWRRSVYLRQRRKEMPTIFETFDLPQMNPNCTERKDSTVVSQPLHMLHNRQVRAWAQDMADRTANIASSKPDLPGRNNLAFLRQQAEIGFTLIMARAPSDSELAACVSGLTRLQHQAGGESQRAALVSYCHALINTAGFLYVD